jgi:hypothetical protein
VVPGKLRDAQNIEIGINGGYITVQGYERFDGQTSPSSASYSILEVTISGSIVVNDVIEGASSGATATVLSVVTSTSPNYLVISKITGTFSNPENLEVSAVVEGATVSTAMPSGASTPLLDAQYRNSAADLYRADIDVVPGSGDILGVVHFDNTVYAFRDNAGGTAANLYKSSAAGWVQVTLGRELSFTSGGTTEIVEGNTITGATSGATATVDRVVLLTGTWAAGTAAGKFILSGQTGTFQAENLNVGASPNLATIAGNSSAITLLPGGRYEFWIANFGGQSGTRRIYGCDGVNRGFEFDGEIFVPISTGMTSDIPTHVVVHKNHLFFSFGSSAQHSGTGEPYIWSPVFGASELATGDDITGFMTEPGAQGGATLAIYNRKTVHMLYGSDTSDWVLVKYRDEVGAYAYSIQQIGTTFYLDDRGVNNLFTAQEYGNFQNATISQSIQTYINTKKTLVSASCIARNKSQYRLFFSDGSGLYITLQGKRVLGLMPVVYSHAALCAWSSEDNTGNEVMFFGSSDGYVYQMDVGTSFDGDTIEWFGWFHFNFLNSLLVLKKYLDITFETQGEGYSEFQFTYQLGYAATDIPQPSTVTQTLQFSSVYWDSFVWDQFTWDGLTLTPTSFTLSGEAENISVVLRAESDYFSPLQFNGDHIAYTTRRRLR